MDRRLLANSLGCVAHCKVCLVPKGGPRLFEEDLLRSEFPRRNQRASGQPVSYFLNQPNRP